MKDVYLFLIGFSLGITSFFLLIFNIKETSDIINIISIFVNIGIAVFVAYFIQNKITNNRYVKEYIISVINSTSIDYELLLKNIRNGNLNRKEINQEFKYFSMKFTSLDTTVNDFLKKNNNIFQPLNRNIHRSITNSVEFNNTVTNSKVKLRYTTLNQLNSLHKDWIESITSTILKVNSK